MVSLYPDVSSAPKTFDVRLTANGEPARCMTQEGCQISLQPPNELEVLDLAFSVVPYNGNVTVLLEDAFLAAGKIAYQ